MIHIKFYEDFKLNNQESKLITKDDVIGCIKNKGVLYSDIIDKLVDHDPDEPLNPVDIDEDGLVTIEYNGSEYTIKLKNIKKIEF